MTGILVTCCEYIDEFPAFSWDAWSDCTCKGRNSAHGHAPLSAGEGGNREQFTATGPNEPLRSGSTDFEMGP